MPSPKTITIMLWNVAMTPNPPPRISTRRSKERAPHIANIMSAYDVVVLNESFLYRGYLFEQLNHTFPYSYTEPRTWYKPLNSGVVILSKVELFHLNYTHYSKGAIWDWFTSKGLLGVSFKIDNVSFDLYGTHLQAGDQRCAHHARASQTQEIVAHVQKTHEPSHELIICGDFNCGPVYDIDKGFSGHYTDRNDALLRDAQYQTMVKGLSLTPLLEQPTEDDICSFLTKKNSSRVEMKRIPAPDIHYNGESMSDTGPLCIQVTIHPICPVAFPMTPSNQSTNQCFTH